MRTCLLFTPPFLALQGHLEEEDVASATSTIDLSAILRQA
jgi:hypothetical protein